MLVLNQHEAMVTTSVMTSLAPPNHWISCQVVVVVVVVVAVVVVMVVVAYNTIGKWLLSTALHIDNWCK